jgi:tetratricopeptide (TPR) repeat protein
MWRIEGQKAEMHGDRYGNELSTTSAAAAHAWTEGADRFLAADADALAQFDRAIAEDDAFALAHAGRARVLLLYGRMSEARTSVEQALACAASATTRERKHIDIVAALAAGDANGALALIRTHVERYPRDAFALQPATNVFGLIGLSGRAGREQEVFDLLQPLAGEYGNDWWYLGTLGFWHTELGRLDEGLEFNRRAFDLNSRNANAVHGLAHAWYERGETEAAIRFLDEFLDAYPRHAPLRCHLAWHRALLAFHAGDPSEAWATYADAIDPRTSHFAPALNVVTDSVSFLWQAGLYGESVTREQWGDARAVAMARFPARTNAFLETHRAIAQAMSGDEAGQQAVVRGMREAITQGNFAWGEVTPDAIEALLAFARRDFRRTIELLAPRQAEFVRIGGSHAQRDLFLHTMICAYLAEGLESEARTAAESVAWRTDRGARALMARSLAAS